MEMRLGSDRLRPHNFIEGYHEYNQRHLFSKSRIDNCRGIDSLIVVDAFDALSHEEIVEAHWNKLDLERVWLGCDVS